VQRPQAKGEGIARPVLSRQAVLIGDGARKGWSSREDASRVVISILTQPAWRDASPGGSNLIVDVISPSSSAPGQLDWVPGANRWGSLGDVAVEVKLMATRGAQSERPRTRRQSGVVDLDGSLRPELH